MNSNLIDALHTDYPATDRADKMSLYGWLIGSWKMDALIPLDDATKHTGKGEIYFGWVLEGRAIQDVWILPDFFYGTTLRIYDPVIDAWHILWSDPLKQYYFLAAAMQNVRLVQVGIRKKSTSRSALRTEAGCRTAALRFTTRYREHARKRRELPGGSI